MRISRWWVCLTLAVLVIGGCSSGSTRPHTTATTHPVTSSRATTTSSQAGSKVTGASWATYDGDASRSGIATDGPASPMSVHRLWSSPILDADVYAQPLVVGDRIFVATEHDTVYALNVADGTIVWQRHLGEPVAGSSLPCGNVDPVGITGTPVVDVRTNRLYAVGLIQPTHHVLFALDTTTGRVVGVSPVDANGADPAVQNQRGALAMTSGAIVIPYGGRWGDCGNYHGRLVSVPVTAAGLGTPASYTLPTQREGGFWAPPGPVIAPDASMYLASGNSSSSGSYDYGNSVVRLTPSLQLADSWAPTDWAALNAGDTDIGSTSPVLLPGDRVFQIGKQGVGYLLNSQHLGAIGGQLHSGDVCGGGGVFGGIAHDGNQMFVPCTRGLVEVTVNGDTFSTVWRVQISTPGPPVISNGAVWTIATSDGNLVALDEGSGRTLTSQHLGPVPSRFTSPALGAHRVIAPAGRIIDAFGN